MDRGRCCGGLLVVVPGPAAAGAASEGFKEERTSEYSSVWVG